MEMKLNPIFARHLSLGDSATSLFKAHIFGEIRIIIGSNRGRFYQLSLNRFDKFELIYEDPKQRQIIAIGYWPFTEEFIIQSNKLNTIIWLHFRASTVSLFELSRNDCLQTRLILLRELPTDHNGFCQTLADSLNGRIFIPDHEDNISTFRVRYKNGGETIIRLKEEFLNKKLAMKENDAMFKGMLMGIEPIENGDNCVFLAFEDSTICVFNWRTIEMRDALKHPKHCEFLCWSLLSKTNQTLIAISVVGQIYLLSYFDNNETINELLRVECILKKCRDNNSNCTSIAFNKNSQNNCEFYQLGVGLKNGNIMIYSLQSNSADHSPPRWSHQLLAQCENAHSNSIQCLRWIPHPNEESATSNSFEPTILCSGSDDEKISFYELCSF